ncbi:hypothetical protein FEDK69T_22680 [Flavobacterium enshiense DK69]|uniref:Uncharacterized protein n=1 Tax=Flavobacterium enshiense DK69 TaxID=1107311 RepID=V6SD11_9FLAO|nr:hypothetical protein FEDK69T_22680 [Flavobacterium enshiense DK69]KGO97295.1 hypothetical protein Q767_01435 [Flavobacterium enshiense DK69]
MAKIGIYQLKKTIIGTEYKQKIPAESGKDLKALFFTVFLLFFIILFVDEVIVDRADKICVC